MRFRVYIAASLDGFVATLDGGLEWLEPFGAERYGYDAFLREIDTIVIGRRTFDQVMAAGQWPYAGKDVYVMTSRPLPSPPPRTVTWDAGARRLVAHIGERGRQGDVWILGGPTTINGFRRNGVVDRYELFILPMLLGLGIPLFVESRQTLDLRLADHQFFHDGAVRLVYEPRLSPSR